MRQATVIASWVAVGLCFALAAVPGCSEQRDMSQYDPSVSVASDDPGGYHEVNYNGAIYVLTGAEAELKLKHGKLPTTMPSRFGPRGERVFFEPGSMAMEARLQGEYARRHQLAK